MRAFSFGVLVLVACGESDAQYQSDVDSQMHDALTIDLQSLVTAATAVCDSAPTPQGRGWDAQLDALSIEAMKSAWRQARDTYERIEGAVAPLFPALDFAIDSRYEQYLAELGPAGDAYAFDDRGVVGLDAIERIVWSDAIPQVTVNFEMTLVGYAPAAFPATQQEATDFKNLLCAGLVSDTTALQTGWNVQAVDAKAAYGGLISLIAEQHDELVADQIGAEESRYSQTSLDDLRSNADGIQSIYGIFRPWIVSKNGGSDADARIEAGVLALQTSYAQVSGDAIPYTASADYANLLAAVTSTVDPNTDGTLAFEMNRASTLLGF